jgi:serine protease Do
MRTNPRRSHIICGRLNRKCSNLAFVLLLSAPGALRAAGDLLSAQVQAVYQRASGAVVKIQAEDESGKLAGTGFFVDPDGTIYTNYSVGGESRDIVVSNGVVRFPATRIAADARTGIAILKIEAQKTPFLPIGKSSDLAVASMVMTLGYPMELPLTPSAGCVGGFSILAGTNCLAVTHIRANVPVQRGEAGAPLLNMDGEVVGIVESSLEGGAGCYVLPIEAAEKVRKDVMRFGEVRPGWLGVTFDASDVAGSPVKVVGLVGNSPATKAGMQTGDVILKVGDRNVETMEDVMNAAFYLTAGDEVPLSITRGGQTMEIKVQAMANPETAPVVQQQPTPAPVPVFNLSVHIGN